MGFTLIQRQLPVQCALCIMNVCLSVYAKHCRFTGKPLARLIVGVGGRAKKEKRKSPENLFLNTFVLVTALHYLLRRPKHTSSDNSWLCLGTFICQCLAFHWGISSTLGVLSANKALII